MAERTTRLNIDVAATDRASPVVRDVAQDVEALEGEHEVDITAEDKASDSLADIRSKLDGLTEKDRVIALKAEGKQLEREVRNAESVLRNLSKFDGDTIRVRLEARDNASKKLDEVRTELRQLDGETARVRVDSSGAEKMDASLQSMLGTKAGAVGWGGLAGMIAAGAYEANQLALDVATVSSLTGASLDQASRLVAAWRDSGLEVSDLNDILLNVNGVLRDNPELADKLGVKIGENTSLIDVFLQALKGIDSGFDSNSERAQAMATLFGEEGVRQVAKVEIAVGNLQTKMDETKPARIVDPADLETARKMNEELAEFRGHIDAANLAMLPWIEKLNTVLSAAEATAGWIKNAVDWLPGVSPMDIISGPGGIITGAVSRSTTGAVDRIPGVNLPNWVPGAQPDPEPAGGRLDPQALQVIINPPGTPAATNGQQQQYLRRNGVRLS